MNTPVATANPMAVLAGERRAAVLAGELRAAGRRCLPSSLLGAPSSRRVARRESSAAALRSLGRLRRRVAPRRSSGKQRRGPALAGRLRRRGAGGARAGLGSAGGRALERLIVRIFQIYPAGI